MDPRSLLKGKQLLIEEMEALFREHHIPILAAIDIRVLSLISEPRHQEIKFTSVSEFVDPHWTVAYLVLPLGRN